ncbi:IclR family transcriptional regulator [Auritidibacter ignavus]|uniref:IclR family transcriptional regulator n=1 Tax=Auritidibacter ignavus TaxID=678932 RepID=UPI002FE60A4F
MVNGVQSVERAFLLLEHIAGAGGEISLSELAEQTALPLPTIHRLLKTLAHSGYVRHLPNKHYRLGPRLIRLGDLASQQLGSWARPYLAEVTDAVQESTNMAVLDGDMATYVAQVPSAQSMRMFTEIGRRVHTNCSGVGKAMLSQLPDEQIEQLLARAGIHQPTGRGPATVAELLDDIRTVRARGYATDHEEQELGVRCFAVPVPDLPTPAAISVSGPVTRVDAAFKERAVPLLQRVAWRIARVAATRG